VTLAVLLFALAFGGADQYLGSISAHPWLADISLLSAPWLAVPLLAGLTQPTARRGALVGFAATAAALAGYAAMTLSPVENAHFSLAALRAFIVSDPAVFVGACLTGPLFGWLGQQRRTLGLLLLAGATALEPVAHAVYGGAIRADSVAAAEISAGALLAAYVSAARAMRSCSTR
jgi:hypothetical protein